LIGIVISIVTLVMLKYIVLSIQQCSYQFIWTAVEWPREVEVD